MDTCSQPHRPELIHTLTRYLPPPLADTPEALIARNQAAIAEVAALLPTNANEARLAAQCVAARAQADDVMRLLRVHDGDIQLVIKLNAQYVAMSRTSFAAHGHLLRAQAVRHKREQNDAALNADEWTQYIAGRSMQQALDAGPVPAGLAAPQSAPAPSTEEPRAPGAEPAPIAQAPVPVPIQTPPPATAAAPPVSAAAPVPSPKPAPQRSRRTATPAEADDPPRNLSTGYGPPDDDLVHAIVTGTTPALRALDGANATGV